ncbi:MAG TPA: DUF6242 domain-containing protein [Paludibacteraceae bacterium]|nr:DUF6242 domain-containing protein [Paludibacteraceae bacterium]HRU63573.1 DUF6242 domain-containing protein [Paludibacteraceae bacterium]
MPSPYLKLSIFCVAIIFLNSCLGDDYVTDTSNNPCFVSLSFLKNDSVPNLENAVFTLVFDETIHDSIIVNLDSLPYQTRIDSVYAVFSFKSSSACYLIFDNDSLVTYSSGNPIDFTKVSQIKNIASDGVTERTYYIKVNVHQVDPELYVWKKLIDNVYSFTAQDQKAIYFKGKIYFFVSSNAGNFLYNSTNGTSWTEYTINGLPPLATFQDIQIFNDTTLFLTQNNSNLYFSTDGINWSLYQYADFQFSSLLFVMNNQLWAIVNTINDGKYRSASSNDGSYWQLNNEIPANFPISNFTSISFYSRTKTPKALVINGTSVDNQPLGTRWSTENGSYWVDFSIEDKSLDSLDQGAPVIFYDDKLFILGRNKEKTEKNYFRQSIDEGLSWQIPDSNYNYLPEDFQARHYSSFFVFNPRPYDKTDKKEQIEASNRIYIIGGKNSSGWFSDVWTGKVNKKNFLIQ